MENKIENPNAFPVTLKDNGNPHHPGAKGMTLRDYFAGQIITGLLGHAFVGPSHQDQTELMAERAYKAADAMLKQRLK